MTCCSSTVFHRKIYKDNGYRELVGPKLDEDLEALVRCMRQSDLVGLEANCILHYLPHRVAVQFAFDQAIPGHLECVLSSNEVAWNNYCRPITNTELYVPPRVTLPCVTTQYLDLWRGMNVQVKKELPQSPSSPTANDGAEIVSSGKGSSKCLKRKSIPANNCSDSPPPGFARKHKEFSGSPFSSTTNNRPEVVSSKKSSSKCLKMKSISVNNDSVIPSPDFDRKHSLVKENVFDVGTKETGAEVSSIGSCRNNQLQECGSSIKVNPSLVKSSTDELLLGLEKRISTIEKLCHWIKAGKLDLLIEIGKQLQKEN